VTQSFKLPVFSVSGTCFRRRAGLGNVGVGWVVMRFRWWLFLFQGSLNDLKSVLLLSVGLGERRTRGWSACLGVCGD
jgi:hypothetical protein